MSFFTGAVAGAVLAGGVGQRTVFDNLHELSERMNNPRSGIEIPPAAAERIAPPPFSALVKQRWNEQVGSIFRGITEWRPSRS
ncbi:hypothetical protein FRC17_008503 [Serendipita sp. 399]|nr:hypothetical protein FRC17_008503 [Serendipita sp. 399]